MESAPAPDMSPTAETAIYPVLDQIEVFQTGLDASPYPGTSHFAKCQGLNKHSARRCNRDIGASRQQVATTLLAKFKLMQTIPNDDTIYDDIETFLEATHCHDHIKNLRPILNNWKALRPESQLEPAPEFDSVVSTPQKSTFSPNLYQQSTPPSSSPLSEDTYKELVVEEKLQDVATDQIAKGVSGLNITSRPETPENPRQNFYQDQEELEVFDRGIASIRRNKSLHQGSPIIKEVNQDLTLEQQTEGRIYILEHPSGMFHINWTTTNWSEGQEQPVGCCAGDVKLIYQTPDAYYAAPKAKRLAEVILEHQKWSVQQCQQCGGAHKEWFRASKNTVCETVFGMETFVKMPAYSSQDGAMKLSPAGQAVIQALYGFSIRRLEGIMALQNNESERQLQPIYETPIPGSEDVSQISFTTDVSPQPDENSFIVENDPSSSPKDPAVKKPKRRPILPFDKLAEGWNKTKDAWSNFTSNPKEGIETTQSSNTKTTPPKRPEIEKATWDFLWSLFPQEVKGSRNNSNNDQEQKSPFKSFTKRFTAMFSRVATQETPGK